MPFDSEKQRAYLFANKPDVAKRIAKDDGSVKKKKKRIKGPRGATYE